MTAAYVRLLDVGVPDAKIYRQQYGIHQIHHDTMMKMNIISSVQEIPKDSGYLFVVVILNIPINNNDVKTMRSKSIASNFLVFCFLLSILLLIDFGTFEQHTSTRFVTISRPFPRHGVFFLESVEWLKAVLIWILSVWLYKGTTR